MNEEMSKDLYERAVKHMPGGETVLSGHTRQLTECQDS